MTSSSEILISPPEIKGLFKKVIKEIAEDINNNGTIQGIYVRFPKSTSKRMQYARIMMYMFSSTEEIVENLNYVLENMQNIAQSKILSRIEKVKRFRLLTRLYMYEFARIVDVHNQFLSAFKNLSGLPKSEAKRYRQFIYSQLEPVIQIRNRMIHDIAEPTEEEQKLYWFADSLRFHRNKINDPSTFVRFDKRFARLVKKRIIIMRGMGRQLVRMTQAWLDAYEVAEQTIKEGQS